MHDRSAAACQVVIWAHHASPQENAASSGDECQCMADEKMHRKLKADELACHFQAG